MDIFSISGYLSGIISALCIVPYVRDILAKKTKPERASWTIWTLLGLVAFFSQLSKGAGNSLWMPGVQTLSVLTVAVLSIKYGAGGLMKKDIWSIIFALFGIFLWFITEEPLFALLITIMIDATGSILTLIKSYKDPESETLITWLLSSISGLFSAISVGSIDWILLMYPLYIFAINLAVVIAILKGREKIKTR